MFLAVWWSLLPILYFILDLHFQYGGRKKTILCSSILKLCSIIRIQYLFTAWTLYQSSDRYSIFLRCFNFARSPTFISLSYYLLSQNFHSFYLHRIHFYWYGFLCYIFVLLLMLLGSYSFISLKFLVIFWCFLFCSSFLILI